MSQTMQAVEYKAVRRAGLRRFPYVVYYRIAGASVEVIAVQHGAKTHGVGVPGSNRRIQEAPKESLTVPIPAID